MCFVKVRVYLENNLQESKDGYRITKWCKCRVAPAQLQGSTSLMYGLHHAQTEERPESKRNALALRLSENVKRICERDYDYVFCCARRES